MPATVILVGIGGLIGAGAVGFWPVWSAAVLGAVLGDSVSYWLGYRYKWAVARVWPLSRYPELLPRGEIFFRKWGAAGVFFGRFTGPLRAAVPLIAGIFAMPMAVFQIVNVGSALVWATGLLLPGAIMVRWLF